MLNDFGEMFDDLMLGQGPDGTTWAKLCSFSPWLGTSIVLDLVALPVYIYKDLTFTFDDPFKASTHRSYGGLRYLLVHNKNYIPSGKQHGNENGPFEDVFPI